MTLIELAAGLTISSLIVIIIGALYISTANLTRRGKNLWEIGDASVAMETLTRALRQASRHPNGVMIWERETEGIRHDVVGVAMARALGSDAASPAQVSARSIQGTGWSYFYHDPARGELRRLDHIDKEAAREPPTEGGMVIARDVRSFSVTRDRELIKVMLIVARGGHTMRLRTEIWPRNE